ncbi:hypothetical protein [Nonomuraea dietziae]|uniref:hypothetical protein n=1 Tax=Nonomuraea dietziae TaxID=65515 RepID=UPI0033F2EC99
MEAPLYSYDNAIRETAWVELDVDLDRDGHRDRLAADIIRPSEPVKAWRRKHPGRATPTPRAG